MGNQASATFQMQKLLCLLPLHAEEGRLRDLVSEDAIISQLGSPDSESNIALIRRIFESFSLLDKYELIRGNWAFVSFPASLMARSLLAAWAVPEQRFVDEGYWEDSAFLEEQRTLLHQLEIGRMRYHPSNNAMPIRFVHVAWAVIRLGNDFLLHQREDKLRPDSKQYVLPGGRLRPSDFRGNELPAEMLRDLSDKSRVTRESLSNTLIREIEEELSLQNGTHYTFEQWRSIKSYCAVEGGGNKHALTRYEINLYTVKLTSQGETCLLDHIVSDSKQLLFFNLNELIQGKRTDGTTAYIDALHKDMGDKFAELFGAIPDSCGTPYALDKAVLAVDLPSSRKNPFLRGRTGKEQEVLIPLADFEWELILFLGWCARGFSLHDISDDVLVLGGGWVKLLKEEDVKAAKKTATKLAKMDLPLLQFSGDALRLASKPECTFFSDSMFCYEYALSNNEGGQVDLHLKKQATRFAALDGQQHRFRVPRNIANVIETIRAGKSTSNIPAIKNAEKSIQKQNLDTVTNEVSRLGLRRLIKIRNNAEMSICVLDRFNL